LALSLLAATIVAGGQARAAALVESFGVLVAQAIVLNRVQSLDHAISSGHVLIKLTFLEELTRPPAVLQIHYPTTSIAFDFAATTSAVARRLHEINQHGLRSLELVPAQDRTRLVVNLNGPHVYETELKGKELLITLRVPGAVSGEPRHSLRDVSFEPGTSGAGRITIELSDPAIPINVRQQGRSLVVDFHATALPPHLARRLDVTDFGTPVRSIETRPMGAAARMVIEIAGAVEYSAHQITRHLVFEPRAGAR
jgi:type IV pilus assembly protein PilQ